jgi:hypothetical protein
MDVEVAPFDHLRDAELLRQSWQSRVLLHAKGQDFNVVLSMLAHSYDDAMLRLLRITFRGFYSIRTPFLCSAGKIDKWGSVYADEVTEYGRVLKKLLYPSETHFRDAMRRLADRLKLTDAERVEMLAVARRWVVCDYRLDPTMDPRDPDAKRLVAN